MRCNCTITSPNVKSPIVEEEADVDGAEWDGAEWDGVEWEGRAVESDRLDRNCASLRFTVVAFMAHMKVKWSNKGKGTKKWRKILVIAE